MTTNLTKLNNFSKEDKESSNFLLPTKTYICFNKFFIDKDRKTYPSLYLVMST